MSCDCEFKKAMQDLAKVRELARKAAKLTDQDQVVFKKKDGTFGFVGENMPYDGIFVEYVLS